MRTPLHFQWKTTRQALKKHKRKIQTLIAAYWIGFALFLAFGFAYPIRFHATGLINDFEQFDNGFVIAIDGSVLFLQYRDDFPLSKAYDPPIKGKLCFIEYEGCFFFPMGDLWSFRQIKHFAVVSSGVGLA